MNRDQRYRQAQKMTLISAITTGFLGILKVMGGFLFHSHALVADGIHSFSDLLTDTLVLVASKYGSLDADDSHPYGHQRIETAATLLLSVILIIAGFSIAWDALDELLYSTTTKPNWLSLPIITLSIAANEFLFHYTHRIGLAIRSPLLIANAWHHRSDAASSIVVLIGLIGSLAGLIFLDTLAAVVVGIMIIKMGWDYAWNSVKELIDTAVDPDLLAQIRQVIEDVDGVERIHQLRSRLMGNDVFIDVHILVSPKISVSEGHYIAQHVHYALMDAMEDVKDVIVHVDPEDDEICSPSLHLPNKTIINQLLNEVKQDFPEILFWNVHYLNGKISLDIVCSHEFQSWKGLGERMNQILKLQADIHEVRFLCMHETIH